MQPGPGRLFTYGYRKRAGVGGGGSLIRNMALISFPETAKFVK